MLLQINDLPSAVYYLIGAIVTLGILFLLVKLVRSQEEARRNRTNPRSKNINETNYNIARPGIDDHRLPNSSQEAKAQVEDLKATKEFPTDEEFYAAKKKL